MARPPLILKRETLRLIHPADTAIDREATPTEALTAYAEGEVLDTSALILRDDEAPTYYVVRALTDHEVWVGRGLLADADADKRDRMLSFSQYMLYVVSVGLVSVENLEGWDDSRKVREHGVTSWEFEQLEALGSDIQWLFSVIQKAGELDAEKKRRSGSSGGRPNGTTAGETKKASGVRVLSTAVGDAR